MAAFSRVNPQSGHFRIYLDLVAAKAGIDLAAATIGKFNRTSERFGFPERLGEGRAAPIPPDRVLAMRLEHGVAARQVAALHGPARDSRYWIALGRAQGIERAAELLGVDLGVTPVLVQADDLRRGRSGAEAEKDSSRRATEAAS